MKPLISVIIPTYQHAGTIGETLGSVLAQDYPNIEVIVVDDGSTDNTKQAVEPFRDSLTYVHQENRGANAARNQGFLLAKGEFVIFVDADVAMKPDMLTRLADALFEHPEVSIAYSGFRFGWKKFRGLFWDADRLRRLNYIHTTSLVRRVDFPGFDETIRRFQDWDVWLTMLEAGKKGILVPKVLFRCVIEGKSRIGSSWMPRAVYRLPWARLPWQPKRVAAYCAAREIIVKKHHLPV